MMIFTQFERVTPKDEFLLSSLWRRYSSDNTKDYNPDSGDLRAGWVCAFLTDCFHFYFWERTKICLKDLWIVRKRWEENFVRFFLREGSTNVLLPLCCVVRGSLFIHLFHRRKITRKTPLLWNAERILLSKWWTLEGKIQSDNQQLIVLTNSVLFQRISFLVRCKYASFLPNYVRICATLVSKNVLTFSFYMLVLPVCLVIDSLKGLSIHKKN